MKKNYELITQLLGTYCTKKKNYEFIIHEFITNELIT